MDIKGAEENLRKALAKVSLAQNKVYSIDGTMDSFQAVCYLTIAKKNIRTALKHIQKITPNNEGGNEDEVYN